MRSVLAAAVCVLFALTGCGGSTSVSTTGVLPPIANAGGPYTGTAGTAIAFSGAGSTDPQGQKLTYSWQFGDTTTVDGVAPTHSYLVNSSRTTVAYTVKLTVTNTSGLAASATTTATVASPTPLAGAPLTGVVSSGAQLVYGAHVYLLAANTTGYGQASVSLLSSAETGFTDAVGGYVLTAADGSFSLTGDYSCDLGQQLYILAVGGNTGGGANYAIGLMAALGACPTTNLTAISATVNEVSTVAAAYALAGFATDATHISSASTALAQTDVANAFANAANLVSLSTGNALTTIPAGNGTVPQAQINTLANILVGCVNTTVCNTLLTTTTSDGTTKGVTPTETATAAINIAHHPGANVAALYQMAGATFTPKLAAQPNDFTVGLNFVGGGLNQPQGIAIDGSGNAWIANKSSSASVNSGNGSITEISSAGAFLSGSGYATGGLNAPAGIAIDSTGYAWITNTTGNTVSRLSSTGSAVSGSPYAGGGLKTPGGIAIDASGNIWIANVGGNSVTELSGVGSAVSGSSGYTGGGLSTPQGVAVDATGSIWITNYAGSSVSKLSGSGAPVTGSPYAGMNAPFGIAIDSTGNAWVANSAGNNVVELSSSGTQASASPYTGSGLGNPVGIALDGAGNAWIVNTTSSAITELSSAGAILSGTKGYLSSGVTTPQGIAVDGSGNVWVTSTSGVTELVGAGVPVVTPLVTGVQNNTLATRP